jgi:hypothetical protein
MGVQSFVIKFLKLDRFEPNRIVTSNIVSPKVLCAIRAIELLYVTIALVVVWCNAASLSAYLKYFTNLSFFGRFAYLLVSLLGWPEALFFCLLRLEENALSFL